MESVKNTESALVVVNNIPKHFHSVDLRNFFTSFVESGAFVCFHFRHRPEVQKPVEGSNAQYRFTRDTCCCVAKVYSERVDDFIQKYDNEHWLDKKGETLPSRCHIKKIHLSDDSSSSFSVPSSWNENKRHKKINWNHIKDPNYPEGPSFKKGLVGEKLPSDQETFSMCHLESLIELKPPSFMPNGNIGTTTSYFLDEIRGCRLPPNIITKLGLEFPRSSRTRMYGNVKHEYIQSFKNQMRTSGYNPFKRPKQAEPFSSSCETVSKKTPWCPRVKVEETVEKEKEKESSESEEEEWDRVEALHDDVSGQERNKERLFEDKIELKWEKGGSGLVFYTDAQYWDKKDGDFDEKTADDWDVDTRVYEGAGVDCDKDMKDLIRMKLEQRNRDGTETEVDRLHDFAAFEKYSSGFGRKILESQGWKQGEGVGKSTIGIAEPIPNDGQNPLNKNGFGYHGEKLWNRPKKKKKHPRIISEESDDRMYISTIYDNPIEADPPESVFTSSTFAKLKYRKEFLQGHSLTPSEI